MANDIYFGSKRPTTSPPTAQNGAENRAAAAREPQNGAAWSRTDPAKTDPMTESMRSLGASAGQRRTPNVTVRRPSADRGQSGGAASHRSPIVRERPGDYPYRPAPSGSAPEAHPIAEQIDSELLHRAPTQIPFNYIDTEDSFSAGTEGGKRLSDRKREKLKHKRMKEARRNAKRNGRRRKKSGFGRFLKAVICLVLAVILLVSGASAYVISGSDTQPMAANAYVDEGTLLQSPAVYNLLLMGIDMESSSGTSRSDSMILLSIDNAHMKLKMTSFMRDSYVYIPGHGEAKLNAACTYGGAQLVCDTIEYNFGVRIDGCVKVGYEILMGLVDGVGGITVPEVDATEAAALAAEAAALGREDMTVPMGTDVKLNGFQTMMYCRIRKGQDDFYRTERQREVLGILIRKALLTNPVKLAMLGRQLIAKAQCSIPKAQLFALVFRVAACLPGGTASARIPQDGTWYDDMRNSQAVLVVNFEENRAYLEDFIYG